MSDFLQYDEKIILELVSKGDEHAFKNLFNRYWDEVYAAALVLTKSPELSEDIAQDVFAEIWTKRENLVAIEKLQGYLFIAARNKIFNTMRRKTLMENYMTYLKHYFREESLNGPENHLFFKQSEQLIHLAIASLPPQQQRAFRLSRFEGLKHEEIAHEMGLNRQTVKNYIVKSIIFLKKYLAEHGDSLLVICFIELFLDNN